MGEIDNAEKAGFHQMDKQDLTILIHSLKDSSVALLSKIELGDEIKRMTKDTHEIIAEEFEKEFQAGIGNFSGEAEFIVRELLEVNAIPISLMEVVKFNLDKIKVTSEFPLLYRRHINKVMEESFEQLDNSMTNLHELVEGFKNKDLPNEIVAKCVMTLYHYGAFS